MPNSPDLLMDVFVVLAAAIFVVILLGFFADEVLGISRATIRMTALGWAGFLGTVLVVSSVRNGSDRCRIKRKTPQRFSHKHVARPANLIRNMSARFC